MPGKPGLTLVSPRAAYTFLDLRAYPATLRSSRSVVGASMVKSGRVDWWLKASMAARERASRRRAFYAVHFGADDLTRARPSLAPVRWLHVRPSVFWDLPERQFASALAERKVEPT
jgi:hypothetical protein